jgi:Rad3-related DNA helicase
MSTEKEMWDEIISIIEENQKKEPEIVVYTNSIEYVEAFHEALKEELKNRYGLVYEQTNT